MSCCSEMIYDLLSLVGLNVTKMQFSSNIAKAVTVNKSNKQLETRGSSGTLLNIARVCTIRNVLKRAAFI